MKVDEGSGTSFATAAQELHDGLFGKAFEASPVAMAITRMSDSVFVALNDAFCRVIGYEARELIGRSALDLRLWADPADREDMVRTLLERRSGTSITATFRTRSGALRTGTFSVGVVEHRGEALLLTTVSDITERIWAEEAARTAEEQLRTAEAKYRTLVENMPAVTYVEALDADPEDFYMSPQVRGILGYDPEDFLDPTFWGRHIHPDDREWVLAEDERVNRTHEPFDCEFRFIAADGRTVWLRDTAVLVHADDGRPLFWQGLILDISEQKGLEDELRQAEARYRRLVEQVPAITYIDLVDDRLTSLYVSPQVETMLGLSQTEWIDDPDLWAKHVHPEDRERAVAEYRRGRDTGEPFHLEYRMVTPDGRIVWIHEQGVTLKADPSGARVVQGLLYDVTGQKEAEEQVLTVETKYRTLVENIPAITYLETNDPDPVAFYMSPQVETILGYTPEDFLDPAFWGKHIHPDDRERALALESRSNTSGEPYASEYRMIAADGRTVWIRDEAVLARDDEGQALFWQGVLVDVTEQKEAEAELQRSLDLLRRSDEDRRRLLARVVQAQEEERRRIAGEIHDDSIQKMAAVGLRLQTLHRKDLGPEERRLLEQLGETVELSIARLRKMMFGLRPPALDRDGLAAALIQHLEEIAEEAGFDPHLENRLVTEPPRETRAIAYRIAQEALANVRKHAEASRVDVHLESREEGLLVRIKDDGKGFDWRDAASSTVHVGLSAMRERAELAGGRCRVESAPHAGTKVEFWLPCPAEEPPEET